MIKTQKHCFALIINSVFDLTRALILSYVDRSVSVEHEEHCCVCFIALLAVDKFTLIVSCIQAWAADAFEPGLLCSPTVLLF